MSPEPKIIETLSARKDRRALEAEAAWKEHQARELAVNANMIRLREERLAREARAAEPRTGLKNELKTEPKIKPARVRRKAAATSEVGAPK
jgi:hypothetical protein